MEGTHSEVRLSREMRLLDVTMIGVGAMIGAAIFVLTGIAVGVADPALILVFALNAVVSLFTAMVYAELGSCFHDAGGGYLWVKHGLPGANGFLSGWMSWFAHSVACSLYADDPTRTVPYVEGPRPENAEQGAQIRGRSRFFMNSPG